MKIFHYFWMNIQREEQKRKFSLKGQNKVEEVRRLMKENEIKPIKKIIRKLKNPIFNL